jgi:hypothetical protein
MKKLIVFIPVLFLIGCAAFQQQPALQNFNGLDLYHFIDAKADSAQARLNRLGSLYSSLYGDYKKNLDAMKAMNDFLNKEAADGKLDISTITELNRRGFSITIPESDDLPSSLPDSIQTNYPDNIRKK